MTHIPLTPFGRGPAALAHLAAASLDLSRCPSVDKWTVLAQVRTAREGLGITDRDVLVLHALLSFLPARELGPEAPLVVFPSNRTLADRAHGMAESTLRRHLGALVAAGLVARRDSPNGKRYAARTGSGEIAQAYGIDLGPLLARAGSIAAAAHAVKEEALELSRDHGRCVVALRDVTKLAALAQAEGIAALPAVDELPRTARLALRRTPRRDVLDSLLKALEHRLDEIREGLDAALLDGNDAQNERHSQESDERNYDSVETENGVGAELDREPQRRGAEPACPLSAVMSACPDILTYQDGPCRDWDDLIRTADRVAPFMGIDRGTWLEACGRMGRRIAAGTLAAMLQRAHLIRNAGGYLRSLVGRHEAGKFVLASMINALPRRPCPGGS